MSKLNSNVQRDREKVAQSANEACARNAMDMSVRKPDRKSPKGWKDQHRILHDSRYFFSSLALRIR